ncbi:MAG: NUDIX hydrolase [Firmicutes bacterium]|nr:NUDIX hydrolase [Bacillota bacterium]
MAQAKKHIKTETVVSSGGVVFRKADGRIEVALTAREDNIWVLPKGLVEKGESLEEAALREVNEEAGLTGEIIDKIGRIDYWYFWHPDSTRYHKFVYFYLIRCIGGDITKHDWEVREVRWFPIGEAIEKLAYKDEKKVVEKAKEMLEKPKR